MTTQDRGRHPCALRLDRPLDRGICGPEALRGEGEQSKTDAGARERHPTPDKVGVVGRSEGRQLGTSLTEDELIEDFRTFYFETALSGFETNLVALESFAPADHLLFGTDFPAVTVDTAAWYTNNVARFYESRPDRHAAVVRDNALALIPSLA